MMDNLVSGKTSRRQRKARFSQDPLEEMLVAMFIAHLNAARRASGKSEVCPGALAGDRPESRLPRMVLAAEVDANRP